MILEEGSAHVVCWRLLANKIKYGTSVNQSLRDCRKTLTDKVNYIDDMHKRHHAQRQHIIHSVRLFNLFSVPSFVTYI